MILVSCRRNFTSDQFFSERNVARDYHGTMADPFDELSDDELAERADGRHVVVFVHGYRNPIKSVDTAYRQVAKTLTDRGLLAGPGGGPQTQYGLAVGFAWPGFRTRLLGFVAARPSANRAGGHLRALVELLRHSARTVDVQTHSLGARVALQALATGDSLWVDNLMLTAPAVDDECLLPTEEFHESLDSCNRAFVYHSQHDGVLKAYSVLAIDRALGARGPEKKQLTLDECPNVYVVDCQSIVKGHSDYRKQARYFDHWARVMNHAPLQRYEAV